MSYSQVTQKISGLNGFTFLMLNQLLEIIATFQFVGSMLESRCYIIFCFSWSCSYFLYVERNSTSHLYHFADVFWLLNSFYMFPWNLCVSSLRRHSLELPDFLFNVDSLLFRSAVELQPWNFFSLDSWVSATIFLYISYFLCFHSCFIFYLNYLLHDTRIRDQLFESLHI